jgi:3-methyladenine DNA glycosylase AlkD
VSKQSPLVKDIHDELVRASNQVRREKIAEYLKTSKLGFIGVELPDIHRIVKSHTKAMKPGDLVPLMHQLWDIRTFETRLAAIDMMKVYAKNETPDDALSIIDPWIDDLDTWGLSDPLCQPCIGTLVFREPDVDSVLVRWQTSDSFWRRRCSVLPYLFLCLKTQYESEYGVRVIAAVRPHIGDKEFFVGKAAGWVLRELSKRNPGLVKSFIEENKSRMTALVKREASQKL